MAEIRINVRTTAEIKRDIEIAARLRGLTVSSLINFLAVNAIREEKEREPKAFLQKPEPELRALTHDELEEEIRREENNVMPLPRRSYHEGNIKPADREQGRVGDLRDEVTNTRKKKAK